MRLTSRRSGDEAPEYQYWFNKQRTCVVGPGAHVVVPRVSYMVDYEGELAMVVGQALPERAGRPSAWT